MEGKICCSITTTHDTHDYTLLYMMSDTKISFVFLLGLFVEDHFSINNQVFMNKHSTDNLVIYLKLCYYTLCCKTFLPVVLPLFAKLCNLQLPLITRLK